MAINTKMAANKAVGAIKSSIGHGIQGVKNIAQHELSKDAWTMAKEAFGGLRTSQFATQAAAYGVVGGATGYALSDDPKRGIRDGIALGVLGAATHNIFANKGARSAAGSFGKKLGGYGDRLAGEASFLDSKGRYNPGANRAKEAAAARKTAKAQAEEALGRGGLHQTHAGVAEAAVAKRRAEDLAADIESMSSATLINKVGNYKTPASWGL